jgi:hypothetical protein
MVVIAILVGYLVLLSASLVFLYSASVVSERPEEDRWAEENLARRAWLRKAS